MGLHARQWTPDARRLLTGNDKGQFTLWNGASFNYESITQVHDDSIRSFTYSHNGQALVSADKGGTIKYFTPHLTNIHGFQGHREACHDVSWSPNDERFVTCGDDGLVKIWSYREAKEERSLSGASSFTGECCKLTLSRPRLGCEMRRLAPHKGSYRFRFQRHARQILGPTDRQRSLYTVRRFEVAILHIIANHPQPLFQIHHQHMPMVSRWPSRGDSRPRFRHPPL